VFTNYLINITYLNCIYFISIPYIYLVFLVFFKNNSLESPFTTPLFLKSLSLTIIGQPTKSFKHGSTLMIFWPFPLCTLSSPHWLWTSLWYELDFGSFVLKRLKLPLILVVCSGSSNVSCSFGCHFSRMVAKILSEIRSVSISVTCIRNIISM